MVVKSTEPEVLSWDKLSGIYSEWKEHVGFPEQELIAPFWTCVLVGFIRFCRNQEKLSTTSLILLVNLDLSSSASLSAQRAWSVVLPLTLAYLCVLSGPQQLLTPGCWYNWCASPFRALHPTGNKGESTAFLDKFHFQVSYFLSHCGWKEWNHGLAPRRRPLLRTIVNLLVFPACRRVA